MPRVLQADSLVMEVGLGQHVEELALGALVDAFTHQFAVTAEDEGPGNAGDVELFVDLAAAVDQDGKVIAGRSDKRANREGILIGDR